MSKQICIIGMGHVGLTLAVTLAEKGFDVSGVEKNPATLESIKNVSPPFFEENLEGLLRKHSGKGLKVGDRLPNGGSDVYIIAVGTPYEPALKRPKLEALLEAAQEIASVFPDGALILLRSTVPVGTSRKILIPIFQKTGKKFYFASTPERTCEGVALKELLTLPQVIGGMDRESFERAKAFFETIAPKIVEVTAIEMAEIIKLMDNCWRDTTFAFANEMAMLCESLGLDAFKAIELANLGYTRNTIPKPGFVGGPCLTKDPYLLMQSADPVRIPLSLIKVARLINQQLAVDVWRKVLDFFIRSGKDRRNCKVLISGLAFKGDPPTDDLRGSCALDIIDYMKQGGIASIYGHDFVATPVEITKLGITACSLEDGFENVDVALFMNNHGNYGKLKIDTLLARMNKPAFFFDAWHIFSAEVVRKVPEITYGGIGF